MTLDSDTAEANLNLFHTVITNRDIAASLKKEGIPISARGVKEARLANGWRRQNNDPD